MFTSGGDGGGDDPYNFDIADGFGGGGSKKKSKESKFGKSSLNKTVGASPSASSLIPQDSSPTPSYSLATAANDSKSSLRASAPAAPTSALDKAMSFLDKYRQGNPVAAPRRSTDIPSATFDEDELEISLSSDSDVPGRKPARKSPSKLKTSRNKPVLKPQAATEATPKGDPAGRSLTLTGMPSSARFATAKELGIALEGPKSAVSPLGLQNNNSTKYRAEGARSHADVYLPSEGQSPGLRLAVNIPGESSTHTSLGADSEVESVSSAVAEALEEKIRREEDEREDESRLGSLSSGLVSDFDVDVGRTSRLVSPTPEQQNSRETGDTGFARAPDRSSLGKIISFDELAAVSGQQISSVPESREENGVDDGSGGREGSECSVGDHGKYAAAETVTEDEDNEDGYSDDDFEDQDVLMESNGEKPREHLALSETTSTLGGAATSCFETVPSRQPVSTNGTSPSSTTTVTANASSTDKKPHPATGPTGSRVSQPLAPVDGVVSNRKEEVAQRPREAWGAPAAKKEETRLLPVTSDSGTSPAPCMNPAKELRDEGAPENNHSTDERTSSGAREAWGMTSASALTKGDISIAYVTTGEAEGVVGRPHIPNAGQFQERENKAERGTGKGNACVGIVSKGGLLIDRSTEVRHPIRPPDSEVKVVVRAEAVASVEYAHDPESGLDLRSCGTQMVGNSAAVQANIAVPGMVGTHPSVNIGQATRSTRTAGVGYQPGGPYANWGRFACEMPTRSPVGRNHHEKDRMSAGKSSLTPPRRCPRSPGGGDLDGNMEQGYGMNGGNNCTGGAGHAGHSRDRGVAQPQHGNDGIERDGGHDASRTPYAPVIRGEPAYLEMFLESMAKSQAENRYTWQQVLESPSSPQCGPRFSDEQLRSEDKAGTAEVAEDTNPCVDDGVRNRVQARHEAPSAVDEALHSIMAATQDSFREQLANMRENLNKIRLRAEVAGRQSYAHNYESVRDVHDWLARARPPTTSQAEALMMVDPSLTVGKAEALAGSGTVPPSPVEPQSNRAEGPATNNDSNSNEHQ